MITCSHEKRWGKNAFLWLTYDSGLGSAPGSWVKKKCICWVYDGIWQGMVLVISSSKWSRFECKPIPPLEDWVLIPRTNGWTGLCSFQAQTWGNMRRRVQMSAWCSFLRNLTMWRLTMQHISLAWNPMWGSLQIFIVGIKMKCRKIETSTFGCQRLHQFLPRRGDILGVPEASLDSVTDVQSIALDQLWLCVVDMFLIFSVS